MSRDHAMPLSVFVFTVDELRAARLIGAGGCGRVFRGTLASVDGPVDVAVKRWTVGTDAQFSHTALLNELSTLGRIAHPNLLPVRGFTYDPPELMLVTQHMPGEACTTRCMGATRRRG